MFDRIRTWYHNAKITALQMAIEGRDDAEKQVLTEETMADWHDAERTCSLARANFQRQRQKRLEEFIKEETGSV
jgi:hypothetical protein